VLIGLIAAGGVCAGVALWLAVLVQMRPRPNSVNWNGSAYQAYVISRSARGATYLNASRALGLTATVLVFTAGIVALVSAGG
jgi:hypothetical protein